MAGIDCGESQVLEKRVVGGGKEESVASTATMCSRGLRRVDSLDRV